LGLGKSILNLLPIETAWRDRIKGLDLNWHGGQAYLEHKLNGTSFEHRYFPLFNENGQVTHWALIIQGNTDAKSAEETLKWELMTSAAISQIYERLISPFSTIVDVANGIVESAKALTTSECGYVSMVDPKTGENIWLSLGKMFKKQCRASRGREEVAFPKTEKGLYHSMWERSVNALKPLFTNDAANHQGISALPEGHVSLQRLLSVPVTLGKEVVGQIALANKNEDYTNKDLEAVRRLAQFYALAIQRVRAEGALLEAKSRYEGIFKYSSDGVAVYQAKDDGADFVFVDFNEAGERIDAIRKQDLVNKSVMEVFPRVKEFGLFDVLQRVWLTGKPEHFPVTMYKDERISGWRDNFVYKLPSGEVVALYRDETARKAAEQDLKKAHSDLERRVEERTAELAAANDLLGQEIQARKSTEEELKKINRLLEKTFASLKEAVFLVDPNTRVILKCNPSVETIFGYSEAEVVGNTTEFMHVDHKGYENFGRELFAALNKEGVYRTEYAVRRKDGMILFTDHTVTEILTDSGNRIGLVSVVRDITGQKRYERMLRESEERYRTLVESSSDAILMLDDRRNILSCNNAFLDLFGYRHEEVAGKSTRIMHESEESFYAFGRSAFPTIGERGSYRTDWSYMRRDGSTFPAETVISAISPKKGRTNRYVAIIRDITQRKRADEYVHRLTHQLMKAQESERQKLSYELHDSVAQDLAALKIHMNNMITDCFEAAPQLKPQVSEMSGIIDDAITGIQNLASDLRPPALDHLGIVKAIFQYCQDFSASAGIQINFDSRGLEDLNVDFDTEIILFRLIQEGLTNIKKHAEAKRGSVALDITSSNIVLQIEDDGKGFDVAKRWPTSFSEKHMGLQIMKERASSLGGKMMIESLPIKGTKILINIPIIRRNDE